MKRGDIVLAAAPGDYGKIRPAVIVQSEFLNVSHSSIIVCLMTTDLTGAKRLRLKVYPSEINGLQEVSQIMLDKIVGLPRNRIRDRIGTLEEEYLFKLGSLLALVLGLSKERYG